MPLYLVRMKTECYDLYSVYADDEEDARDKIEEGYWENNVDHEFGSITGTKDEWKVSLYLEHTPAPEPIIYDGEEEPT